MAGTVIDPFDAVMGAGVFGSAVFAVAATPRTGPSPGGLGVIGGSGFPRDWLDRLRRSGPGPDLDESEVEELIALGLLR